jgi:hypothetical protein
MVLLRESGMTQLTRQRLGLIKALPVLAGEARVDQFVCRFRPTPIDSAMRRFESLDIAYIICLSTKPIFSPDCLLASRIGATVLLRRLDIECILL